VDDLKSKFREKLDRYANPAEAKEWFVNYFTLLAGIGITIVWLFKELLGFLFSPIPGLNPLIPAEKIFTRRPHGWKPRNRSRMVGRRLTKIDFQIHDEGCTA